MGHEQRYGSDVVTDVLDTFGIEYAAINPGASIRGVHASLVSKGRPELVLALHENVAVAIAHGYAKAAGKPMAVFLHDLVGLQSGSMGIFNAWADQVPMVLLGGSGPADATTRRPWIDWVHSPRMQSLVVRDYVKWDDQPASIDAVPASLSRAYRIATTVPYGPTYVALDAAIQEAQTDVPTLDAGRQLVQPSITAPEEALEELADALVGAENPVIVADYVGKSPTAFDALRELAETLAAPVVDLMARHNLSNRHWSDCTAIRAEVLPTADLVLCLDLRDLAFGLGEADNAHHGYRSLVRPSAKVMSIGTNRLMLRGFIDYSGPDEAVMDVLADTGVCLPVLVSMVAEKVGDRTQRRQRLSRRTDELRRRVRPSAEAAEPGTVSMAELSRAVHRAVDGAPWQLANGHLRGHVRAEWDLSEFNAHLGRNVGAGLGHGIGASIGAGLAHLDDDTIVVNLQADGDLLYTPQGLWTAQRYRVPVLTVMANNRTYGQDRMHQALIAKARGDPLENATVGIDLEDPAIDFAMLARAQGVEAWGPVTDADTLYETLARAVRTVREDRCPAVVDVVVTR